MNSDGEAREGEPALPDRIARMLEMDRRFKADDAIFAGRANRRFQSLVTSSARRWPGVEWVNEPTSEIYGFLGEGRGWRAPPMFGRPVPRFRTRSKKVTNLSDLCMFSSGWLLASARFGNILRDFQPESVDMLPVEVELGDGTIVPAGQYNMVDVTCCVPAYDLSGSGLTVERDRWGVRYQPPDYRRIVLRDHVVGGLHLFRDEVDRLRLWVSTDVRRALEKARVKNVFYFWPDRVTVADVR